MSGIGVGSVGGADKMVAGIAAGSLAPAKELEPMLEDGCEIVKDGATERFLKVCCAQHCSKHATPQQSQYSVN